MMQAPWRGPCKAGGMSTKAEQFRYQDERDPNKKSKKDDRPHVTRSSRMSKRTSAAGAPLHENVRAAAKATTRKEKGTRKSTRKAKKGLRAGTNLERKVERKQRAPQTSARRAKAKATRARGSGK